MVVTGSAEAAERRSPFTLANICLRRQVLHGAHVTHVSGHVGPMGVPRVVAWPVSRLQAMHYNTASSLHDEQISQDWLHEARQITVRAVPVWLMGMSLSFAVHPLKGL